MNTREQRVKLMTEVLTKIVQRAGRAETRTSTYHLTCAVPAGLLQEAADILGINREF